MSTTSHLLRLPQVLAARGISRSKLYLDIKAGLWTPPITIGINYSAWPSAETEILISAFSSGMIADEIRVVVKKLVEEREIRRKAITGACLSPGAASEFLAAMGPISLKGEYERSIAESIAQQQAAERGL